MKNVGKNNWPVLIIVFLIIFMVSKDILRPAKAKQNTVFVPGNQDDYWLAPSLFRDNQTNGKQREMIMYGQDMIAHTAKYLGPNGSLSHTTNGMNCQNCHLEAGTRTWGNNYGAVASTYPKFRERSGAVENIPRRVNDCIERSLNGKALDTASYQMQCIVAYMKWLGHDVPQGLKPKGAGIKELPYLNRAANAKLGKAVYINYCQQCHGSNGQGALDAKGLEYEYPPLWGTHSYNTGAGLYRLSRFAGYVKANMPFKQATYSKPVLTDDEAWDVAAYVNSQPRPVADIHKDWPKVAAKPFDHPFGPYSDGFSEQQHKLGPFAPIVQKKDEMKKLAIGRK